MKSVNIYSFEEVYNAFKKYDSSISRNDLEKAILEPVHYDNYIFVNEAFYLMAYDYHGREYARGSRNHDESLMLFSRKLHNIIMDMENFVDLPEEFIIEYSPY